AELIRRVTPRLQAAFNTESDVLIVTTSGTGGLECAVVNTLSPGDHVLSISIGNFGERLAQIAATYGARVTKLSFENGRAADPDRVTAALREHADIRAVLVTHNETSTGVTNPLEAIAAAVRPSGALLLVDAVSSLTSIPVKVDAWCLDVVVSGSQKGWMLPPGLAFVSMSPRAWDAYDASTMPRFYFDLGKHRDAAAKGQTPFTPAVSLYFALEVALDMLEREGWESIFARHQVCADQTRAGVKRLGLELLADERFASNTVTAVKAPTGLDVGLLRTVLREQFGVVVGGGQAELSGKIFRIGHLGLVHEQDIDDTLRALGQALPIAGFSPVTATA
ncbi:MAG: pyridoxal-phosphate-dependent aminotransferase family protein, partial [Dehalococcoidia bacterium]